MFCEICDQRTLNDGTDSYVFFTHQMNRLYVDSSVAFSFDIFSNSQGYKVLCRDCIFKGYVSPFGTQKTYAAKDILSPQEIDLAREISIAWGKGEDISRYIEQVAKLTESVRRNIKKNKKWWQFWK